MGYLYLLLLQISLTVNMYRYNMCIYVHMCVPYV